MKTYGAALLIFAAVALASATARRLPTVSAAPVANVIPLDAADRQSGSDVFPCSGSQRYILEIKYKWSSATHPNAYPPNGAFSDLVAATHSQFYTMWAPTDYASRGVQRVAEIGDPTVLVRELNRELNRDVLDVQTSDGPTEDGTETIRMRVRVDGGRSRVSAISMLFPSPDWFTGVDQIEMCDAESGEWLQEQHGDLSVWDAGSDRGQNFNSPNRPLNNLRPIVSILRTRFDGIPVGMWTIARV